MKLRLSDPAYGDRLAAFLEDLGHPATAVDDGLELATAIPEGELEVYLGVWSVLEPGVAVNVDA
ncbi:MAG: hypothetical protein ICV67_06065 [Thermoleophilia bacterium]|nr:hypothetical protein [Thermoleophilia bacterium]